MKTKKLVALLLAVVMALGLGTTAFASSNEKVQINNMMVDRSLVDPAMFDAEEDACGDVNVEAVAAVATSNDLDVNANLPPIKKILVQGFDEDKISSSVGIMQGNAVYTLTMPAGTTTDQLTNKTVTFALGGTTTTPAGSEISITYGGQKYTSTAGGTIQITMTLEPNHLVPFTANWTAKNSDGTTTAKTRDCQLAAYASTNRTDVSISKLTIANENADISTSTAGGVTRYFCVATLENVTSLTGLTVEATLGSSNANATLGGANGTKSGNKVTFTNVDLTSSKELVVTNTTYSRTYQVSASISGRKVNVYIAIRTYTVSDWLDGTSSTSTNYYNYVANGYGSGADISDTTERTRIAAIATELQRYNTRTNTLNTPISTSSNNRRIFAADSYCRLRVDAGSSVMSALKQFLAQEGLYETGSENNYISYMGNGTASSAQIGEFDCGSASGWMYTARNARDDLSTPLPNAGAANWTVSNNMYIDWYYTAAYGADFGYSMFDLG